MKLANAASSSSKCSFCTSGRRSHRPQQTLLVRTEDFHSDAGALSLLDSNTNKKFGAGVTLIDVSILNLDYYKIFTSAYVTRSKSDINDFLTSRPKLAQLKIERLYAERKYHKASDLIHALIKAPSSYEHDPHYTKRLLQQAESQRVTASLFAKESSDRII